MRVGWSAVRYVVVGIVGLFFSVGLYSLLIVYTPSLGVIWPAVITKLLWIPIGFVAHSRWSFPSKKFAINSEMLMFLQFAIGQVLFFLFTPASLHVLHNLIGLPAIFSYTVTLLFSVVCSFLFNFRHVFKPQDLTLDRIRKPNVPPDSNSLKN